MTRRDSKSARVWLSLGSNVGDRSKYLRLAREALAAHPKIRILRVSSELDNPALFYTKQSDFLNQILECETSLRPYDLLDFLQKTEKALGRVARFKNGPREIDLDILLFGNERSVDPRLRLPHPGLHDRPYLQKLFGEFGMAAEELADSCANFDSVLSNPT